MPLNKFIITYDLANGQSLKMILSNLQDRQEPGEIFNPFPREIHRGCGVFSITSTDDGSTERANFYKWLDHFVNPPKTPPNTPS